MQDPSTPRWLARIAPDEGPVYRAVADAIGDALAAGELTPGARLPTHRALARTLGVDLTTVTRAYAEARRRGLVAATVGRGTFVAGPPSAPADDPPRPAVPVDLSMNLPPRPQEARLEAAIADGIAALLRHADPSAALDYRTGCGSSEERQAGAGWLAPVLPDIDPQRVLVCQGAQMALFSVLATLASPGDVVLADALTYPGMRTAAARLGIRLAGVAGDAEGIRPDALEEACREHRPRALYVTPTMNNPTATTMSAARREAIAGVARRHDLMILEDDAYGLLPSRPLPAIAAIAPDRAIYVSTVSKVLSPALRVAFLVAPDPRWAARLCAAMRAAALMPSPLLTGLAAGWIADGTAHRLLSQIRTECHARQVIAHDMLARETFAAHPDGLHVWLSLPPSWDRRDFVAHLHRQGGLALVPSDAFALDAASPPNAVRLCLGAAPDRAALRGALRMVAAATASDMVPDFADIV